MLGMLASLAGLCSAPGASSGTTGDKLRETPVFVAGTDGYHTYRIPTVVLTRQGTLLAFCEGRKNSVQDAGAIDLLVKRSADGGRTWSQQQVVWTDATNTCGNPAPVVDRNTGTIWLLMSWNLGAANEADIQAQTSRDTRRVYVTSSTDDGHTWAQPREITAAVKPPSWRWYATGPVNGIQLMRGPHPGRLVIPCNHTEPDANGKIESHSHIIYSDNHGVTWQLGGTADRLTNESTVAERADGSLLLNMRSYRGEHCRANAISTNAGATWLPTTSVTALVEPVCQGSLLSVNSPDKTHAAGLLFSNPASLKREQLTVRLSCDNGATWPASRVLHAGPAAYSCLVQLSDDTVGCLYECGEKRPYERIVFTRLAIDSIKDY